MPISRERAALIIHERVPMAEQTEFGRAYLQKLVDGNVEFDGEWETLMSIMNFVREGVKRSNVLIAKDALLEV